MVSVVLRLSGEVTAQDGTIKTLNLEDGDQFVIGRDEGCDWTIDDPRNRISRKHCVLHRRGDAVMLTDYSSNGTALNSPGNELVPEQMTELPDTVRLYLGGTHAVIDYECERETARQDVEDDIFGINEHRKPRGTAAMPVPLPSLDLMDDDPDDRNNPLGKTLGAADHKPADALDLDDMSREGRKAFVPEERPEDRHTFKAPPAADPEIDLFAVDGDDDPFGDLTGGAAPGGGPGSPQPDALDLDFAMDPPTETAPSPPPPADPLPPITASVPEPEPEPQLEERPAPPPPPPAARADDDEERLFDALFIALGIPIEDVAPEDRRAFVIEVGRTFRTMADGLRELLVKRHDAKLALTRVSGTQFEHGANPLKFARGADAAVKGLLRPETSSLMTGVEAAEDAIENLKDHNDAMVIGVRASVKAALDAFDPRAIEKKLDGKGLLDVLPMRRDARLWVKFVENYDDFTAEAQEDIRRVIGEELDSLYSGGKAAGTRGALKL